MNTSVGFLQPVARRLSEPLECKIPQGFEIVPGKQFEKNPKSRIFRELKRICSSAADMQVELDSKERFIFRGTYIAHIRPASYKGDPQPVKRHYYIANPDGSGGEEICEYVIRDFEIRFYSQHKPGEVSGDHPLRDVQKMAEETISEIIPKYLDAINKEYICFDSPVQSMITSVWMNADETIKSTTYTTFSIVYPESMEELCVPEEKRPD